MVCSRNARSVRKVASSYRIGEYSSVPPGQRTGMPVSAAVIPVRDSNYRMFIDRLDGSSPVLVTMAS